MREDVASGELSSAPSGSLPLEAAAAARDPSGRRRRSPGDVVRTLPKKELAKLCRPSTTEGILAVAWSWGLVAVSLAAVARWPTLPVIGLALVVVGGQQLALAILMHEAVHRTLLGSRRWNDFVGRWLCAHPLANNFEAYRTEHLEHHGWTGTDRDPDRDLSAPYPTTPRSLARKLLRDLVGLTGLRRVVALLLMHFGFLTFTLSTNTRRLRQKRSMLVIAWTGAKSLAPALLTNALLLTACALAGHAGVYAIWAVAYLTTFSVFVRVRSIAEHACVPAPGDALEGTRTVRAGWLARLVVAPHHVNYHLEHHLVVAVPFYNLPKLHALLAREGILEGAVIAPSYTYVLREAMSATKATS